MSETATHCYQTPATPGEAIERRAVLLIEIGQIEVQLANRNWQIGGVRVSAHEYHEWRVKAIGAIKYKSREAIWLKRFTSQPPKEKKEEPAGAFLGRRSPIRLTMKTLGRQVNAMSAIADAAMSLLEKLPPFADPAIEDAVDRLAATLDELQQLTEEES